jgi:DNA-binding MurR/RpiR family transcriptional regulator
VEQLQSPLMRAERRPRGNGSATLEPFAEAVAENIHETFRHITDADLDKLSAMLGDTKLRLHLIGGRFTDPVARYMAAHLRIIRRDVFHIEGQEANWRDHLMDMGRKDVLIVFDIRRYQESLFAFAEKAAKRDASVILFTDQWLSPIARVARHVVTARTAVPSTWDSSAAMLALVEAVIGRITARGGDDTAARIAELERLRTTGH